VDAGETSPRRLEVVAGGRSVCGGLCEPAVVVSEDGDRASEGQQAGHRDTGDAIDLTMHGSSSPAAVRLSVIFLINSEGSYIVMIIVFFVCGTLSSIQVFS